MTDKELSTQETQASKLIPLNNETETGALQNNITFIPASGRSILRHLGTWQGDDYEECLKLVYNSRGQAKFE
ncbi:hypothetical protein RIVM261_089150 [Rivularia sp. IAM M-261]|nr:hypothetical protein RIVM261_089150 [Rivularia sp. IAM M-261]